MAEELKTTILFERAEHAARTIRARVGEDVRIAVVLGSGLGLFANQIQDGVAISFEEIPGFAPATVEGHAGRLVVGKVEEVPIAVMEGRLHFYEGYSLEEVTFPVRVLGVLGIKALVLTNAAGAVNSAFEQGSLMIVSDHLNLLGANPLRGANDERCGPRFPDMSAIYSQEYAEIAADVARGMNLKLQQGVYAALPGPSYETPAEIRMLQTLGADAVGMSTVPEAIVASHMGMQVLCLSHITNMAAGVSANPINHREVIEAGERIGETLARLLRGVVPRLTVR